MLDTAGVNDFRREMVTDTKNGGKINPGDYSKHYSRENVRIRNWAVVEFLPIKECSIFLSINTVSWLKL